MTPLETFKIHSPIEAHSFIEKALARLISHQVKIIASLDKQVFYESSTNGSSGFFNDEPLTFAVALDKAFKDWFLVFIHEYAHFLQYLENPLWFRQECQKIDLFFSWLDGQDLAQKDIEEYSISAMQLEADCEKRALLNIDKFGLGEIVDRIEYCQKANSYFNFYHYVAKHRKWYKLGGEPYSLESVWKSFPTHLVIYEKMTQEQERLFSLCI